MGSIPVGDSDFFFVPHSCQTEYSIFLKRKIYTFLRNKEHSTKV